MNSQIYNIIILNTFFIIKPVINKFVKIAISKNNCTTTEQKSITKNKIINTKDYIIRLNNPSQQIIYKTFYLFQIKITLYIG